MSQVAIKIENLSKAYRIGSRNDTPDTLAGAVKSMVASPFRKAMQLRSLNTTKADNKNDMEGILWALKDVSFDVNEGEVVGVIGRNGAGKSTLLKVLSRITEPTSGRGEIRGRISCLLEVGTGFHPELTGRDNIYMNGTILGMTKFEIDRKFDEIVEFSGVEKFLDTPTKRYSSGMQVRLAFAVAAHLEPEILIVDEVLAVGDADFQKKCMGKMHEVAGGGRTVIFVSHNLRSVRELCQRGIVMQSGQVVADGPIDEAIANYTSSILKRSQTDVAFRKDRGGNGQARLVDVRASGGESQPITTGSPLQFEFQFESQILNTQLVFTIYDDRGDSIMSFSSTPTVKSDEIEDPDGGKIVCRMDECPLMPGNYRLNTVLFSGSEILDHIEGAITFTVESGYMRGRLVRGGDAYSKTTTPHQWMRKSA